MALREALIKAGFGDFGFYWLEMCPLGWKTVGGASRSRTHSGRNSVVERLFSPSPQPAHTVFTPWPAVR
jgi:hypothetical protein